VDIDGSKVTDEMREPSRRKLEMRAEAEQLIQSLSQLFAVDLLTMSNMKAGKQIDGHPTALTADHVLETARDLCDRGSQPELPHPSHVWDQLTARGY
jgi:hypothetical protein